MKKLLFLAWLTFLLSSAFGQRLTQLVLTNNINSNIISFLVDETVILNITRDGKIIDWGVESITRRIINYNYPAKLDKYMGKEEYYPATDNEAFQGKIKYIGRTALTYYSSDENETLRGKLKSIGSIMFEYYAAYEDEAFRGNIKNAGPILFAYFGSFDDAAYKGKLKIVGPAAITYYSTFDDKAFRGKVKSIGRQSFVYYSSYDRREFSGTLKTGSPILYVNGIKYFIYN
ncbi:MAG: hypothetical protein ACR2KX_08990 [Chitinophagaceae bacterium]